MPTSNDIFEKYLAYEKRPKESEDVFEKYMQYESKEMGFPVVTPEVESDSLQGTKEPVFKEATLAPYKPNLLERLLGLSRAQKVSNIAQAIPRGLVAGTLQAGAGLTQVGKLIDQLRAKYIDGPLGIQDPNRAERQRFYEDIQRGLEEKAQRQVEAVEMQPFNEIGTALSRTAQIVPPMAASMAGQLVGIPAPATFGTIAGGQYAREAELEGATPEQQLAYGTIMGIVEGLTERIPFKTMDKVFSSAGKRALISYLKNIPEEGIQEAVSQIASSLTKQFVYKPDKFLTDGKFDWGKARKIGQETLESGGMGMGAAALLGAPGVIAGGIKGQKQLEPQKPIDQLLKSGTIESDIKTPEEIVNSGQGNAVQTEIRDSGDGRLEPSAKEIDSERNIRPGDGQENQEGLSKDMERINDIPVLKKSITKYENNPRELVEELTKLIGEKVEGEDAIGLRGIYKHEIGKKELPPSRDSRELEDGTITEGFLSGTSSILLSGTWNYDPETVIEKNLKKGLRLVQNYGDTDHIAIIKGRLMKDELFNDPQEAVIGDAEVIGYIKRKDEPAMDSAKKKSGLNEGTVDDNVRTIVKTSRTGETPGGDKRTGVPGRDSGLYNEVRGGLDQTESSPVEGRTRDTGELLTQEIKPPTKAVSVSSVSQKYLSKAGFKNAEEAYIAFEAKQKGKEWFKKEFGDIDNADAVYQELIEKADKLTPQEKKKVKFDLQFFAMREKDLGKIAKERFISDRAISRFQTNTIQKTEFFSKEAKDKLTKEIFEYTPKSERESLAEATERVNRDMEAEMERLSQKDSFTGSDFDTYMLIGQRLEAEAKRTGDYTAFTKWMANHSLSANTEPARALQAHVKYSRTAVGAVNEAQSAVNAVERKVKETNSELIKKIDRQTKEVKQAIEQTKKEMKGKTQEQILKEIRRRLENMLKDKPPRVRKTLYDRVIEAVKAGAYDDAQIRDLIKQSEGLPVLTPDDVKAIVEHMDKANKLVPKSEEYLREIYRVQKIIEDKSQATIHDKVRGVMQIALLGRVKTFARNVIANPIFGGVERLSETTNARIANWIFDKVSPKKLGQQFSGRLVNKQFFKGLKGGLNSVINDIGGGWENYKALSDNASIADKLKAFEKDWMNRTDTSVSRGQADLVRKRIFKNEAVQSTLDAIGYMLKIGDEPFVQGWKNQRIEELKQIYKTDKVTPEMEMEATLYALDKTFQNESTAKEIALQLRRLVNKIPLAGDVILPFASTPANIIDKTFEYTPLGLIKIVRDYGRLQRGDAKFNPRVFVQRMGRALTGTELLILGGILFRMGIISGGDDKKSEKERLLQQMAGEQDYSFRFGKQRYSYDWADPIGTIIATGADMARNIEDTGTWMATLSALINTTINTLGKKSFLQSVNRIFGYGDLGKGIERTVMGVPGMFMPGTITQFAPIADKYSRDTKDKNPLKQVGKELVSKIPFASRTLPARIDLFGNKMETYGGANDWFNVLINLGRYAKTSNAPAVKLIADLYERTGDSDVIPKVAPEKITHNNEIIQLTPEERREFQKSMGQKIFLSLNLYVPRSKSKTDEENVKEIKKLIDQAYNKAKDEFIRKKGLPLKLKKKSSSKLLGWR